MHDQPEKILHFLAGTKKLLVLIKPVLALSIISEDIIQKGAPEIEKRKRMENVY